MQIEPGELKTADGGAAIARLAKLEQGAHRPRIPGARRTDPLSGQQQAQAGHAPFGFRELVELDGAQVVAQFPDQVG